MKSKNDMTRWDWVKYDTIVAALNLNDGVRIRAARFLGISEGTIKNYFITYPDLNDLMCVRRRKKRESAARRKFVSEKEKNECHDRRPINWVPQWYKDKYPSLFKD